MNHIMNYQRADGTIYRLPLIHRKPRILFKTQNAPITLRFRFTCPNESCICRINAFDRTKYGLKGSCIYRRDIRFIDSCLFIRSSLSNMISDLHIAGKKEKLPIESTFRATYEYSLKMGYSHEQFVVLTGPSLDIPYEFCTDYAKLENTIHPPPPAAFQSLLTNKQCLDDDQYANFIRVWHLFGIENLLQLYQIYASVDVTSMADAIIFFFNKLHLICGLYPSHFVTLSGLALDSMLANCTSPANSHKSIFIPFLSERVYNLFKKGLIGGFASNQCYYADFNFGLCPPELRGVSHDSTKIETFLSSNDVSTASYVDVNSLYLSCQQTPLPYRNFSILDSENNTPTFRYISKQLMAGNCAYFADMAKYENKGFFIECSMTYNHEDSLEFSIDLSGFPALKRVTMDMFTSDQKQDFLAKGINVDKTLPKLVSTFDQNMEICDFSDCILFLVVQGCCKITRIESITIFEQRRFMSKYMDKLAVHRRQATSQTESKLCKNLGNCVTGKMHQKIDCYNSISIVTDKQQFLKACNNVDFMDFYPMSSDACLVVSDGISVVCRNLPMISARVYRYRLGKSIPDCQYGSFEK